MIYLFVGCSDQQKGKSKLYFQKGEGEIVKPLIRMPTKKAFKHPLKKRLLLKSLPKDGSTIHYLGKAYKKKDFHIRRKQDLLQFKQKLRVRFRLRFKTRYSKYFNIAYRCSEKRMDRLQRYLDQFFKQIYPRYFLYEPKTPWNVVYFKDKPTYIKKTGSDAYGYYNPEDKTFYTYSYSGHGTLWHEMIHAFVDSNIDSDPQEWFNEGFASFYEMAFLINGKVIDGYANWRMPYLKKAIKDNKFTPLKRFLLNQSMTESFGYAEARFLFCYLWKHKKMIPFVRGYLFELAPKYSGVELGKQSIKLMEKLLGKKIERINKEYLLLAKRVRKNQKLKQKK